MDAIIIDTETTDVENCEVIEMYWEGYELPGALASCGNHQFYCPKGEIKLGALCAHHIFAEELVGSPPSSQAPGDAPKVDYWIGHNVDFDWKALGQPRASIASCTLAMARNDLAEARQAHADGADVLPLRPERRRPGSGRPQRPRSDGGRRPLPGGPGGGRWWRWRIETVGRSTRSVRAPASPRSWALGSTKGSRSRPWTKGWANWYAEAEDTDQYLIAALQKGRASCEQTASPTGTTPFAPSPEPRPPLQSLRKMSSACCWTRQERERPLPGKDECRKLAFQLAR